MNKGRLFLLSCLALISTSVCWAVVTGSMGALKAHFILDNGQVGWIVGAATFGFTISIFALGPLVDALGMRKLLWFAFLCHLVGPLVMILAVFTSGVAAFWTLFVGALISAIANGTVEAVCNPLIATIYPEEKTKKLAQFHVWFPGGIVLGAVACYLLDQIGWGDWRVKLGLIFIPTVIYGLLLLGQKFPLTERVQSGLSFGDMVRGAFGRPLFIILLVCMCITASLELGPGRWIPPVLEAGGIPGILVLAYIFGLMAILRFYAGPVIQKLSPTGMLVCSAVLSGAGLYLFSYAETTVMAFVLATVFAVGICYFWPTMLGVVSERVPRSGALGLALMGGTGMLMVGVVTAPVMGELADSHLHKSLDPVATRAALQQVVDVYPDAAADEPEIFREEINESVQKATVVLAAAELPEGDTAEAMREVLKNAPSAEAAQTAKGAVSDILNPADNYGGRMSFRYVAPFSIVIILVFGILYLRDRREGGYKVETIDEGA